MAIIKVAYASEVWHYANFNAGLLPKIYHGNNAEYGVKSTSNGIPLTTNIMNISTQVKTY